MAKDNDENMKSESSYRDDTKGQAESGKEEYGEEYFQEIGGGRKKSDEPGMKEEEGSLMEEDIDEE